MDELFDHDHDGKLSDMERMERDYFFSEMTNHSDQVPQNYRRSGSGDGKTKLVGFLFLAIGLNSFVYFPIFALIMIGLAIYFFVH